MCRFSVQTFLRNVCHTCQSTCAFFMTLTGGGSTEDCCIRSWLVSLCFTPAPFLLPWPCASNNISYFIWLNSAFQICKLRYWLIISLEAISSIQKQFLEKCWRENDWVYNCVSKLLKYEGSIDHFSYRNGLFHASQILKDVHEYHISQIPGIIVKGKKSKSMPKYLWIMIIKVNIIVMKGFLKL